MVEEKAKIIKYLTKEKFVKAFASGNYKDVLPAAQVIIDQADDMDILQLTATMGSALSVKEAKKIDEITYCQIIRKE